MAVSKEPKTESREAELAQREKQVASESRRLAELESKVEATAAKLEAATQPQQPQERRVSSPLVKKDGSKYGGSYRVYPRGRAQALGSVLVTDCCDSGEAIRCAYLAWGIKETHTVVTTAAPEPA